MSVIADLLARAIPLLEPLAKPAAQALARKVTKLRDREYRAHYYPTWEHKDALGFVVERGMDTRCYYCARLDPKRRLYTSPPCQGDAFK